MSILKLRDCELHYEKYGTGSVLVFLHGLSDDLNYWKPLIKYLKEDYTIITLDFRGHGKSTYQDTKISNYILQDDVYQLLKHLNIEKATLIGFSLGGTVSMNFTINHPEMVEKLILMSTFAKIDKQHKHVHEKLYETIQEGLGPFYDMMIPLVLPEKIIKENPELIKKGRVKCLKKNQKAICETIESYYQLNIENDIKNIKQATLIIGGSDDTLLAPYSMIIQLYNEIEDSRILFLNNTKHNVLINENISKIYFMIKKFLDGNLNI